MTYNPKQMQAWAAVTADYSHTVQSLISPNRDIDTDYWLIDSHLREHQQKCSRRDKIPATLRSYISHKQGGSSWERIVAVARLRCRLPSLLESRMLLSGAKLVEDLNTSPVPAPDGTYLLGNIGDWAIFAEQDATHGLEPWRSNGTTGGTFLLKDINPGPASSNPSSGDTAVQTPKYIYFAADDGKVNDFPGESNSLWRTGGTVAGTIELTHSRRHHSAGLGGNLLFFIDGNNGTNQTLWRSGGTQAGTFKVSNFAFILQSTSNGSYSDAVLNGNLFFDANDGADGAELWKSNGTVAGTKMVADLSPGNASTNLSDFHTVGSKVFFAVDGQNTTRLLANRRHRGGYKAITNLPEMLNNNYAIEVAGSVLYILFDGSQWSPYELWRSDGTPTGSFVAHDFSGLSFFTSADASANRVYVQNDAPGQNSLWSIAGHKAKRIGGAAGNFAQIGGTLYFLGSSRDDPNDHGIFRTDGTIGGTLPIKTDFGSKDVDGFLPVGNELYFVVADSISTTDDEGDRAGSAATLEIQRHKLGNCAAKNISRRDRNWTD